jgi:hypothetical protein
MPKPPKVSKKVKDINLPSEMFEEFERKRKAIDHEMADRLLLNFKKACTDCKLNNIEVDRIIRKKLMNEDWE